MFKYDPQILTNAVRKFLKERESSSNKLTFHRSCPPHAPYYTVENPHLRRTDDWEFVPVAEYVPDHEMHFLRTLLRGTEVNMGLYYKVTRYVGEQGGNGQGGLNFVVVNLITGFAEGDKAYGEGWVQYQDEFVNYRIDEIDEAMITHYRHTLRLTNSDGVSTNPSKVYFSDIPWSDRLSLYHGIHHSYSLLGIPVEAFVPPDCVEGGIGELVENELLDQHGLDPSLGLIYDDFEFSMSLCGIVSKADWIEDSCRLDVLSVMRDHEIPILRAIVRSCDERPINSEELRFVNDVLYALAPATDFEPSAHFLYDMFLSFAYDQETRQILSQCEECTRFIYYRPGKKYCSLAGEGRDCGKKARNRRDYEKHRQKRLTHSRKERRLDREFLRRIMQKEK